MMQNYYPVSFEDFLKIKGTGNYLITYCILQDRMHFEMAIENAVFCSQKFFLDMADRAESQAENYEGSYIQVFIKTHFTSNTHYRYYPTAEMQEFLTSIKLYSRLVVKEDNGVSSLDPTNSKIEETDRDVRILHDSKMIMLAEKRYD